MKGVVEAERRIGHHTALTRRGTTSTPLAPSNFALAITLSMRGMGGKKKPESGWEVPHAWQKERPQERASKASWPRELGSGYRDQ
jgi:hypothetical protein